MDDLVAFLRARLDEDERIARAAIKAAGDVPGAANWRFGNASPDEGGTYWHITTTPPDADVFHLVELVGGGMSGGGAHEPEIARHAVEHDPARVLREVDTKRRLLGVAFEHAAAMDAEFGDCCDADAFERNECKYTSTGELPLLRLLALPYADRPEYQETWRP